MCRPLTLTVVHWKNSTGGARMWKPNFGEQNEKVPKLFQTCFRASKMRLWIHNCSECTSTYMMRQPVVDMRARGVVSSSNYRRCRVNELLPGLNHSFKQYEYESYYYLNWYSWERLPCNIQALVSLFSLVFFTCAIDTQQDSAYTYDACRKQEQGDRFGSWDFPVKQNSPTSSHDQRRLHQRVTDGQPETGIGNQNWRSATAWEQVNECLIRYVCLCSLTHCQYSRANHL